MVGPKERIYGSRSLRRFRSHRSAPRHDVRSPHDRRPDRGRGFTGRFGKSSDIRVKAGGSAWDDGLAFLAAIGKSEHGEDVAQGILSFESWDGLASILTKARFDPLRRLHSGPAASISQLANALGHPYRRVHDDVAALERAGLIERSADRSIRILVDAIHAEVRFDRRAEVAEA